MPCYALQRVCSRHIDSTHPWHHLGRAWLHAYPLNCVLKAGPTKHGKPPNRTGDGGLKIPKSPLPEPAGTHCLHVTKSTPTPSVLSPRTFYTELHPCVLCRPSINTAHHAASSGPTSCPHPLRRIAPTALCTLPYAKLRCA